jgi:ParB family transcriptional regulator, chromosome partitioning protein
MNKSPELPQRKALGRGLSTLLPARPNVVSGAEGTAATSAKDPTSALDAPMVAISAILPNPDQPRSNFDQEKLNELAQSIRANGIIQPVTVRPVGDHKYKLIAGERRWRAAQIAGLTEIPVYIRHVGHDLALELALIENIQRADLNPVDTAQAFRQLVDGHGLSHDQVAERTGKDRTTITNFLRLLKLTEPVLRELASGRITVGHARTLLILTDPAKQEAACNHIIQRGLSVRETESYVKKLAQSEDAKAVEPKEQKQPDPNIRAALDEMAQALGTKVRLVAKNEHSGKLEVEYYSSDDLDRIYSVITAALG